jgi:hypothetical protein
MRLLSPPAGSTAKFIDPRGKKTNHSDSENTEAKMRKRAISSALSYCDCRHRPHADHQTLRTSSGRVGLVSLARNTGALAVSEFAAFGAFFLFPFGNSTARRRNDPRHPLSDGPAYLHLRFK